MLTISKRPCQIGTSINTRRELHGDEPVPACDIPILGITLDANELNSLLEEPHAHGALFLLRKGVTEEPQFPQLEPFVLKDKIEGARVSLIVGNSVLKLTDCKLKGLTLQPMAGGLTLLSFKIQSSGDGMGGIVGDLVAQLDRTIEIEVTDGERVSKDSRQAELPINTFGEGEEPEQPRKRRRKNGHVTATH